MKAFHLMFMVFCGLLSISNVVLITTGVSFFFGLGPITNGKPPNEKILEENEETGNRRLQDIQEGSNDIKEGSKQ